MTSLTKITIHWTAGVYKPNEVDKTHYHYLIDGDGKIIEGTHKPIDNLNCKDGNYAAHCGGCNTGNIGVAICGMYSNDYPIKRIQLERACKLCAELCDRYAIKITNKTVRTHAEVGQQLPHSSSYGKIDINNLPCVCVYGVTPVGNWLRNKINWYKSKI